MGAWDNWWTPLYPGFAQASRESGIPVEVFLGLAAHEEGNIPTANFRNNFFGIHAFGLPAGSYSGTWHGGDTTANGTPYAVDYYSFSDPLQAARGFVTFLRTNSRYRNIIGPTGPATMTNPTAIFNELQRTGYAEARDFASSMNGTFVPAAQAFIQAHGVAPTVGGNPEGSLTPPTENNPLEPGGSGSSGPDVAGALGGGIAGALGGLAQNTIGKQGFVYQHLPALLVGGLGATILLLAIGGWALSTFLNIKLPKMPEPPAQPSSPAPPSAPRGEIRPINEARNIRAS